jgi:hypothetical protein
MTAKGPPEKRENERPAPDAAPDLALTHGQTVWLMTELGLAHGVTPGTFNYYIKSLRSLGVPFEKGKGQDGGHRHVTYDLEEIMELTVALLLRVYGSLPDAVIEGLRTFRHHLRPIYRQAFIEIAQPPRDVCRIVGSKRTEMMVGGYFLDLNIRYTAGKLVEFGPPRTISPVDALIAYAEAAVPARSYLPLNLSAVAQRIVEQTQTLPPRRRSIKRARPSKPGASMPLNRQLRRPQV